MSTIGLDSLYYATITDDANGEETYGTPEVLAKAIKCDLSVELAEAILYADDAAAEVVKAFKEGKLSLGVDDIGVAKAKALTGAEVDSNGVLVSAGEDLGASRSRHRRLKVPLCKGTKKTAVTNIRGKRK